MKPPHSRDHNPDGKRFKKIFLTKRLAQSKIADRLGIKRRTMISYLTGRSSMPYVVQYCIEVLLECDLEYLKNFNPDRPRTEHLSRIKKAMRTGPLPAASIPFWWAGRLDRNGKLIPDPVIDDNHDINPPQNNQDSLPPIHDLESTG